MKEVLFILCGLLVAAAGVYYLRKANDAESRKIYTITIVAGLVVAAVAAIMMAAGV